MERQLHLTVVKLIEWCDRTELTLSTSKTTAVHFCRKRRCTNPTIRMNGHLIPFGPAVKFLGVWMDRHVTYKTHITDLINKCTKGLQVMSTVSKCSYGADRSVLLLMYRSLVRSKIDYGSFIYDGASATSKRCHDVIHNSALRIVTGAFRTSPAASVMVEVDEPPLALRRKLLGARYACNVAQNRNHPAYRWIFSGRQVHVTLLSVDYRFPLVCPRFFENVISGRVP